MWDVEPLSSPRTSCVICVQSKSAEMVLSCSQTPKYGLLPSKIHRQRGNHKANRTTCRCLTMTVLLGIHRISIVPFSCKHSIPLSTHMPQLHIASEPNLEFRFKELPSELHSSCGLCRALRSHWDLYRGFNMLVLETYIYTLHKLYSIL
ncbi:hypothetical protein Mp_2g16220 [Marchantia polymorpha subsp. ruderalis]|nr:hypothetical protein Mp_2g16220 [Marchantia polymorpha subsp. ruderalis]